MHSINLMNNNPKYGQP